MVLIFNGAQVLIAVTRSLHSAAELTKGNLQAISFCCTGKYICSGGFYFRHLHPDVEIEVAELGVLRLQDYDALCGEKRAYYSVRQMAHRYGRWRTNVCCAIKRRMIMMKKRQDYERKQKCSVPQYDHPCIAEP